MSHEPSIEKRQVRSGNLKLSRSSEVDHATPERLSLRSARATEDATAMTCENCGWQPLVKYPTINSIM